MFYPPVRRMTASYPVYIVVEFTPDGAKHSEFTGDDSRDDADAHLSAAENPCQVLVDSRSMVITL